MLKLKHKPKTIKKPDKYKIILKNFAFFVVIYFLMFAVLFDQMMDILHYLTKPYQENINYILADVSNAVDNDGVIDEEEFKDIERKNLILSLAGIPVEIRVDDEVVFSTVNKYGALVRVGEDRSFVFMDWDDSLGVQYARAQEYNRDWFSWNITGIHTYSIFVDSAYVNEETKEFYPANVSIGHIKTTLFDELNPVTVDTLDLTPQDASLFDGFTYTDNNSYDAKVMGFTICGDIKNPEYAEIAWEYGNRNHTCQIKYDKTIIEKQDAFIRTIFIIVSSLIVIILTAIFSVIQYLKAKSIYEIFDYRRKTTTAMAHDLKTPLAIASVYVDNLKESVDNNPERAKDHADQIGDSISYLNSLVNDILKFSNSEDSVKKLNKENIFVKETFESHFVTVAASLKEKYMTYEVIGDSTRKMDVELWNQVVANIIDNAIKYGSKSGKIVVTISDKEITVTNPVDTPIENAKSLVEPFVKGENSRGENSGSGLGLAIANNNLARLGYKLIVECIGNAFSVRIK